MTSSRVNKDKFNELFVQEISPDALQNGIKLKENQPEVCELSCHTRPTVTLY